MARQAHLKAAQQHIEAASKHIAAAGKHGDGDHEAAERQSATARAMSKIADEKSAEAHGESKKVAKKEMVV
jgi:hypothetical protein